MRFVGVGTHKSLVCIWMRQEEIGIVSGTVMEKFDGNGEGLKAISAAKRNATIMVENRT